MKVFRVIYFVKGFQRVSIVVAKNEQQAEKLVNNHFELNRIKQCELNVENIIHTEVIEVV